MIHNCSWMFSCFTPDAPWQGHPCARSVASSMAENTVCSQISTCPDPLTMMLQCAALSRVTPGSLSSLPSPPTRLPLTTDISFISLCLSAILLFAPHSLSLCSKFLLLSLLQGHYVLFLTLCHLHSHFSSYSHLFVSLSLSLSFHSFHPFHSFHRPTLADLGGKQAMTVVLAVDREVTFAQPRWDLTATSEPQKQREEDGGVVTAK